MTSARIGAIPLAAVLTACAASAASPEPATIDVVMTEYSYGTQLIEAPAGRPLRLAISNAGKVDHDLVVDDFGVRVLLHPGQSGSATIRSLASGGAYVVHCTIPTHRELGMIATLLVR